MTRRRPTYSGHNEERGALGAFSSVSCDGGGELFKALLKHEHTEKGLSCEEQGPNIRLQEPRHLSLPCHDCALFPPMAAFALGIGVLLKLSQVILCFGDKWFLSIHMYYFQDLQPTLHQPDKHTRKPAEEPRLGILLT